MNRQELLKYMKAAIDLETDAATQEAIIQACENKCMEIKPKYLPQPYPNVPIKSKEVNYCDYATRTAYIVGLVFLFGGLLSWFIMSLFDNSGISHVIGGGFTLMGLVLSFRYIMQIVKTHKENKNNQQRYELEVEQYQNKVKELDSVNQTIKENYQISLGQWSNNMEASLSLLKNHLSATKGILEKLYNKDFIYAKYRNLPALTSIYEYFITGRCTELQGAHGAYNMYEDEVRKDTVISQLNTVIEHLEQIKQNQFLLYQQVSMIQKQLRTVEYELNQIRDYASSITQLTALTAYYTALNERNTNVIMACSLM